MMYRSEIKNTILLMFLCLLAAGPAAAQDNGTKGPFPAETVLLTTDRSIYLSGEMIYVSSAILEFDNYSLSGLSRIVRLELIGRDGKTGIRNVLYTDDGRAAGTIKIPGNLPTGWYRLRAYTSWMRNQGPSLFSYRDIRIINPDDAAKLKEYESGDTLSITVIAGNGTALTGESNRCAVRSVTKRGRPVSLDGYIVSTAGDTLTSFSTGSTGWATVEWLPLPGTDYNIITASDPGIPHISSLPAHSPDALMLSVPDRSNPSGNNPGNQDITVTLKGDIPEDGVSFLAHRTAEWYFHSEAVPQEGSVSVSIPARSLPDGIVAFSFLDRNNSTLATALWIKGDPLYGSGSVTSTPVPGANGTGINTEYYTGPGNGYYTITTRRREPSETGEYYLGAIPGWRTTWDIPLEDAEREGWMIANAYEKNVAESFFTAGDNKPSVAGINYRDIRETREALVRYLPETRAYAISGKVRNADGVGVGSIQLSLSQLDNNFFKTTRTFPGGNFHFSLEGLEGQENLLLSLARSQAEDMELTVDPDFDPRISSLPPASIYLTGEEMVYVSKLVRDLRLEYISRDTSLNNSLLTKGQIPADTIMFYGEGDRRVFIDDYIKLPDMRELIFEVVPEIMVRKKGDDFSLVVLGESPFPDLYEHLILIDGIPLLRYSKLLELPPSRFERIDIVNSLYIHGNQIFAGVVNFVSVNGDMAGLDLPDGSKILSVNIPAHKARGEMVTAGSNLYGFPRLDPTLSFLPFPGPPAGTLSLSVNAVYDEYITLINGLSGSGKWIGLSSPFEIRGLFTR
ncbi:MAG: hypothetical protein V2I34_00065 [Bacteroidales bacterium]|jgi:hypothetical protein|nr:hypothetical protein [Bacteroidales bacterium]